MVVLETIVLIVLLLLALLEPATLSIIVGVEVLLETETNLIICKGLTSFDELLSTGNCIVVTEGTEDGLGRTSINLFVVFGEALLIGERNTICC